MRSFDLFDHGNTGILELQRDGERSPHPYDDEAWQDFIGRLEKIQDQRANATDKGCIEMAISLLNNWKPYMECVMRGEPV